MHRDRYIGLAFLIIGLVFAWSVIHQGMQWGGLAFPSFWGEFIGAIVGIVAGVYGLTRRKS